MRKKYNIRIPKGKEVKNIKTDIVNGNIKVSFDLEDVFEPKDMDFLATKDGRVFIYNGRNTVVQYGAYCGIDIYNKIILLNSFSCGWTGKEGCRLATEQEKQSFLYRLRKECGKRWNEETKQIEDIRWEPKEGDTYFYINNCGEICKTIYNTVFDSYIVGIGNAFKTEEAAKPYADKMKDIFKNSRAE